MMTTETAPDILVEQRLGIVSAECVVGVNALKDMLAVGRDLFGGRSEALQTSLKEARQAALTELRGEAARLGGNAVIGVGITYTEIGGGGKSMLLVAAFGTAVRLDQTGAV